MRIAIRLFTSSIVHHSMFCSFLVYPHGYVHLSSQFLSLPTCCYIFGRQLFELMCLCEANTFAQASTHTRIGENIYTHKIIQYISNT
jgi:hypothetical protein